MNKYFKRYVVDAFGGMSLGLFSTLIIGLIIKQIGGFFPSAVGSGGAGGASVYLKAHRKCRALYPHKESQSAFAVHPFIFTKNRVIYHFAGDI